MTLLVAATAALLLTAPAVSVSVGTGSPATAQSHAEVGSPAEFTGPIDSNDVGNTGGVPEVAPPVSVETADSDESSDEESPLERHENELVVTTLVLNSLLGLLVFAHRFAPSAITQALRRRSRQSEETSPSEFESHEEELLADSDVVTHLLADNGGRLHQSEIVANTDWSKAKVSRLLDDMESDGDIVKIQLGRQNLVCLDGSEPELSKPMTPPPEGGRQSYRPSDNEE